MGDALERFAAVPIGQKLLLLIVVLGGIYAAYHFLYFEEQERLIRTEEQTRSQLNKQLTKAKGIEQNLLRFEAEIKQLKKERDAMRDKLPADAEIADLLRKIHGQAKIVGLEIERFERVEAESQNLVVRIPVKMSLEGTFNQVATFFYYIGKLTRIVNVENIELSAKEQSLDGTVLKALCTATTFMYVPKPAGGR